MPPPSSSDPIFAAAISNINADRFLPIELKTSLAERLRTTSLSPPLEWEAICAEPRSDALARDLAGASGPETSYGHVSLKQAFLRHLAQASGADYRQLEKLLEGLRGNDTTQDRNEAMTDWRLLVGHLALRQRPEIWVFGSVSGPFNQVPLSRLPCCLGLHNDSGNVFLGFEVPKTALNSVRATCVLDATWDYLPLWRATGATEPNCNPLLPDDRGFAEYLAPPPTIDRVANFVPDITAV